MERDTDRIILYPVEDMTTETLKVIIERHVEPVSREFTDGWQGYGFLEECGFEQKCKQNAVTGEMVQCHTNQTEGA